MLNFKKGLAVVLAAATAFTFAPFANLGSTVNAKAAVAEDTFDIGGYFSTDVAGNTTVTNSNATISGTALTAVNFDSLTFTRPVTVLGQHTYKVAAQTNVEVRKLTYGTDNQTDGDITVGGTKDQDVKLTVTFDLKKAEGGSFSLVDMTEGNYSYDQINVKITNKGNKTAEKTTFDPTIVNVTTTGTTAPGYVANGQAAHKNVGTNVQYTLQLNTDNSNSQYYAITNTDNTTYTSWTGVGATNTSDAEVDATSVSGGIEWKKPKDNSGTLVAKLATIGGMTNTTNIPVTNMFKVTTPNESENQISVSFVAENGSSKVTVTKTLRYVVDRSDKAIDWIKWDGNQINFTKVTGSNDSLQSDTKTLDPYINTKKTILVKSESKNITFVSSDSTIVSVEKDSSKYYKANVTAHKAGTATISVYVGGTNNNKGKVYLIPVSVTANATDKITVTDAAGLYGAEEADTIFLDAADSTASNAVKSVKLDIKSLGGNAWDKFKSDDDSIATLATDGTLTAKATNVSAASPKITHLTITTKDNLANHITAGSKIVTVVVWGKPAANFTIDDIYLNLSDASQRTKLIETKPVFSNVAYSIYNADNSDDLEDDQIFTLTNAGSVQQTATVVAKAVGTGKIKALVTETSTTRPTAKIVNVTVGADNANVITSDKTSLVLAEGETSQINAKATVGTVSFTSADSSIATVTTGGAVTAVKAGQTTITASAEGATSVVIPVIVTAKQAPVDTTTTPSKVTGVKVTNLKGGKVKVTWTKQNQKNIKYYVKKTVGKKSAGKSVGSNKTTLSVKKGATVKVKVKAYIYNASGKKLVGTYSKTVTKKTDKK